MNKKMQTIITLMLEYIKLSSETQNNQVFVKKSSIENKLQKIAKEIDAISEQNEKT